jgi:tRNA A37 threonylcarbamoyladenosine modification protein TsaB
MTNTYDISDFPQILLIDTNDAHSTSTAIITTSSVTCKTKPERAQELPALIEEVLKESSTSLNSIKAIGVVSRDGSLTGQRIGITVANTLGWIINVPLFTLEGEIATLAQEIKNGKKFVITKTIRPN